MGFVQVTGAWGLGENVVQGAVNPDEWILFKPTMEKSGMKDPILTRRLGSKEQTMVYNRGGGIAGDSPVLNRRTSKAKQNMFCLSDIEVCGLLLAHTVLQVCYQPRDNR